MGWLANAKKQMDDAFTDRIGDGDYTITTDESTITKPQDDGKK